MSLRNFQPLLMAVPRLALADDFAVRDVERRKERARPPASLPIPLRRLGRGAMAHVIGESWCWRALSLAREPGLGAIQRLHLALLITAEHDGVFGGIQIKPDHLFEFLGEARIVGDFEGADQMGF